MDVVVRPCTPADAYEVESVRVAGWRVAYRGLVPDGYLDRMQVDGERRRKLMTERGGDYAESVAVHDGEIVGWVAAGPPRDEDRTGHSQGEIYACYVRPDWWGRRVGRLLVNHALEQLASDGRTDVTLWVLEGNKRARRLYESCGMRPDGTRKLLDFWEPVAEVRYALSPRQTPATRQSR